MKKAKFVPQLSGLLLVLLTIALASFGAFDRLERTAWDFDNRLLSGMKKPNPDILLVAIDQSSLDKAARWGNTWPWPRDMWARLVELAQENSAKGIIFDILFDDPGIDRLNSSGQSTDDQFAARLNRDSNVVLAMHLAPTGIPVEDAPSKILWIGPKLAAYPSQIETQLRLPQPTFRTAHMAAANMYADNDGVIRSAPLLATVAQDTIPLMAFKMANLLQGNDFSIPSMDADGRSWIRYYGHGGADGAFPYIPAFSLIVGDIEPKILNDKILVVGGYASGLLDYKPTPLASVVHPFPGFELQATILSNLLEGHSLAKLSTLLAALLILIVGILGMIVIDWIKRFWLQLTTVILISAGYILLTMLFFNQGKLLPVYAPLTAFYLAIGAQFYTSWQIEGRKRQHLQRVFSRYMDSAVIEDLLASGDENLLRGRELEATIMFTDMVNFTSASEDLDPIKTVELLNVYHSVFVDIALAKRGMLDKYIGDSVMVVFGAPIPSDDSTLQAANTLLETQAAYKQLSQERQNKNLPAIGIHFGVHTAKVILGNIGHEKRMDYTAIGSGVNTASRLEGATRYFKTENLVSEDFCQRLPDTILRREIARVVLKGMHQPIRTYELIVDTDAGKWSDEWRQAWDLYFDGNQDVALELWRKIQQSRPNDIALEFLIQRLTDAESDIVELKTK